MAEIKDVYSLEFNSSQFQTEINSAIESIDQLNAAMEQGVDVADELESAQANLVSVLNTEAKGVEQLNQKRNALVNTQKQVNAESKTGVAVGKQLDTTNKQIATSTAQAATQQRGFTGSIVQGARQIGSMRRVVSQLGFAFRLMGSLLPFGLIMSFAGPVLSFFGSLFKSTDKTAENMEKLNDSTLTLQERLSIAETELEKLNAIESQRGSLTDEEEKRRRELVKVYQETSAQIIKEEQDRYDRISDLQIRTNRLSIKLRGENLQAIQDNLENERKAIILQGKKSDAEFAIQIKEAQQKERELRAQGQDSIANDYQKKWQLLIDEQLATWQLQTQEILAIEKEAQDKIIELNKKAQEKIDAFNKMMLENEKDSLEKQRDDYLSEEERFLDEQNKLYEAALLERKKAEEKALEERRKAEEKYQAETSLKNLSDELEVLKTNLQAGLDYRENNREEQLAIDVLFLEQQRAKELASAIGNAEAQAKIDENYNNQRKKLENEANFDIIKLRIEFLERLKEATKDFIDPAQLSELNKQIADLKLQLQDAGKALGDGLVPPDPKDIIDKVGQVVTGISDSVFSVLNAQVQAYIDGLDKAIDKSKSALDEIRSNSENYNARQLEIEKERLEKLEAERARAVEREKNLAQIQIAINAAIAVSKAAAEGGGFASAVTIALTLASLVAGFAQARAASSNAFFHGVEYLERGKNKPGRDTIPAMLNEGERVITTDTNDKYWDVLTAVHNNRIPADVLNTFSKAYQQGGIKSALGAFGNNVSLSSELGQKSIFVNVAQTYGGLENRLERIENVLTELPKYMPRTTVSANANGIFRIVEQRQARKNFSRNWSK